MFSPLEIVDVFFLFFENLHKITLKQYLIRIPSALFLLNVFSFLLENKMTLFPDLLLNEG